MFHATTSHDQLDPRRRSRQVRRRDFMSATRIVSIPRMHELIASALARLGWIR